MRAKLVILLLGVCLLVNAQPPIQKFWALNQCNLLIAKLPVKPSAAYSLRKLSCTYTGTAIKVRCDADNATQDIGFTSTGDLDIATLNSFISAHGVTGTGNYTNTSDDSFNVTISPNSKSTSTIVSITGTMGGGNNMFTSQAVVTDGQSIIVGYYNSVTNHTYMNQLTFTFGTNRVTVTQSQNPKRISNDYTSDLISGWNYGTSRTMGSTYRVYTLSFTLYTGNGYVTTWYDQSGNGIDVSQPTNSQQPRIVNNGVIETSNGRPSIRFIRNNKTVLNATVVALTSIFGTQPNGTASLVLEAVSGYTSACGFSDDGLNNRWQVHMDEDNRIRFDVGNPWVRLECDNTSNEGKLRTYALVAGSVSPTMQIWMSGSRVAFSSPILSSPTGKYFYVGGIPSFPNDYYHDGHISEEIFFPYQLNDRTIQALNANQKIFYATP